MAQESKHFKFVLTQEEVAEIRNANGQGGHQSLQRRLIEQIDNNQSTIYLDDAGFGEIVRYMTQYKGGGFQSRLRAAFERSIREQLGF